LTPGEHQTEGVRIARQDSTARFFLYIFSLKVSAGVATRFVGHLKRRVLSARVESALSGREHFTTDLVAQRNVA
jgi:hypothetical protein